MKQIAFLVVAICLVSGILLLAVADVGKKSSGYGGYGDASDSGYGSDYEDGSDSGYVSNYEDSSGSGYGSNYEGSSGSGYGSDEEDVSDSGDGSGGVDDQAYNAC